MRIAVFDYQVVRTNPIGGCHLRMLRALANEHEFTVFAVQFDNPCPERIRWVRVPAPLRPLPLLFVAYHFLAPLVYFVHRLRTGKRFDLVQTVESKLSFGDVAYTHFCHTSYLKNHWQETQSKGARGLSRWIDHRLHALLEKRIYRTVKRVVVPSKGLAAEFTEEFPSAATKVSVLPNAVDVKALQLPAEFNRSGFRQQLGLAERDLVFVFTALGHFERKGLPLMMEALAHLKSSNLKILVVGGTKDLIDRYRARAESLGLREQVVFAGMTADVRPYLWAADAFLLASVYETFSLVTFEAAAASLPLITTSVHGVEEIMRDGKTGYVVRRTWEDVALAIRRFADSTPEERARLGSWARVAASEYDESNFVDGWRRFYVCWAKDSGLSGLTPSAAVGKSKDGVLIA